jgi:hypothetical protein
MSAFERDTAGSNHLMDVLVKKRPSLASAIVTHILDNGSSPLGLLTANLIHLIGCWLPDELMPTVHRLLQHPSPTVRIETAVGLASRGRRARLLHDAELELLHNFARDPNERVRLAVVEASRALAVIDKKVAVDLLAGITFSDSRAVADRLFMYLNWGDALDWNALNPEQQSKLLAQLRSLPDIDSHSIEEFLRGRSAEDPKVVLDLLRHRIEDVEDKETLGRFHPTPYGRDPLALREHADFLILLRQLLAWLGRGTSWRREHIGRDLFATAAGSFDEPVLSLLSDILRSGDGVDVHTVASVLWEAPNDLVFNHVDFVSDALDVAARFGSDALRTMRQGFWASAIGGARWGTPGQPFPQDIRLRDECAAIAKLLPQGSLAADFYRALSESGARSAEDEIERDHTDGRAW